MSNNNKQPMQLASLVWLDTATADLANARQSVKAGKVAYDAALKRTLDEFLSKAFELPYVESVLLSVSEQDGDSLAKVHILSPVEDPAHQEARELFEQHVGPDISIGRVARWFGGYKHNDEFLLTYGTEGHKVLWDDDALAQMEVLNIF
jgi:hypothetical protein